jgi:hypothetical protein
MNNLYTNYTTKFSRPGFMPISLLTALESIPATRLKKTVLRGRVYPLLCTKSICDSEYYDAAPAAEKISLLEEEMSNATDAARGPPGHGGL